MGGWGPRYVATVKERAAADLHIPRELIATWWQLLGVKNSMLKDFCNIDPMVDEDNQLTVIPGSISKEHGLEPIKRLLAYAYNWTKFSTSRWFGHFLTATQLCFSVSVGIIKVMRQVIDAGEYGSFHAEGITKLTPSLMVACVTTCLGMRPISMVLAQIMKDDRCCLHYHLLREKAQLALQELVDMPE